MTSIYGFYTTFPFILNNFFFYNNVDGPINEIYQKDLVTVTKGGWGAPPPGLGHSL